ncbi:DUF3576 domain-containing protein [Rhodobacteraceae bacterium 2CG4]|uniref:DUF3576 domain-containing protein n=1 Tax=Halovulum marinum TaxID=2662447 RepID=A0A6L5Z2B5_9RHOB|nr:DUF3576 domain-containing protein [Halovulum marinum]
MRACCHRPLILGVLLTALAACSSENEAERTAATELQRQQVDAVQRPSGGTIWDLFNRPDENVDFAVNKYLWTAALDVLSFLPLEGADPFSGIITTGWGGVAGASVPYRATVYVTSPALEARSLRVAVFRQSGGRAVAVSDAVAEQIEDAILTRARQLRVGVDNRR